MARNLAQRARRIGFIASYMFAVAGVAALFALAQPVHAGIPFLFTTADNIPIESQNANDVAVGNLNGDFHPDLVVAAQGESRGFYVIMASGGSQNFESPVLEVIDPQAPPAHFGVSVLVADFDNDGRHDVVFGRDIAGVTISPGRGDGTFDAAIPVLAPVDVLDNFLWPLRMSTFDLEGDGDLDLVVQNGRTGLLYVLRNDGNFNFTLVEQFQLLASTQLATGDMNGDGLDDVVWVYSGGVNIAFNNGKGSLGTPVLVPLNPPGPHNDLILDIVVVDLDLDGDLDIIATMPGSPIGYLAIVLNNGAGGVSQITYHPVPIVNSVEIVAADFDGDQRIDFAVLEATGTVYFYRNETTTPGAFEFEQVFAIEASGFVSIRLLVANFDSDCDHDLVLLNRFTSNVVVISNLSPQWNQCTVADFNYSGSVDANDLAFLLGEWGKTNSPADLVLSPRVDAWDLAFLLWGWQQPMPSP